MDEDVVAAVPAGRRRRVGLLGAVVGFAAAGVALGVAAERFIVRRARRVSGDPHGEEVFGELSYDESMTVTVDGMDLYAEIVDAVDGIELDADFAAAVSGAPSTPEPTVIFVHGFCLDLGSFHFQRKELTQRGVWRAVYYDQPGHGRSGRLSAGEYHLPALGDSLKAVIDQTTPEGPIVLVGHSMGGMTIMALAERYPELFAQRVAGVVLISTSAGRTVAAAGAGLPQLIARVGRPLLPLVNGATKLTGLMIDRARQASSNLAWLLTRRYGFGGDNPSPALVSYVEQMNSRTQTETVARYLRTLYTHAGYPALEALRDKPVLLICGDCDPITPLSATEDMKTHLPEAELAAVPNSGHMVLMEHADEVNEALVEFLEKLS